MSSTEAPNTAEAPSTAPVTEAPAAPAPTATTTGPVPPAGGTDSQQAFHSASLYVGDLNPEVNEGLLFEIFNAVGPVSSIRVCRDAVTRRSLGYAYVNFHQLADAERALDTMNYTEIKDKPCRIMWSQRDPSLRRSGVGNIFVKNLHESIDNKQLYDTFSLFGNILSCKVVTDRETGLSKGYGYIHYETQEAAEAAIDKLDGMLIDGQEVQVGVFMRRNERPGQSDWTNCYVKFIPFEWDDKKLNEEFSKFGEVLSASITMGVPKRKPKKKAPVKEENTEEEGEKAEDSAAPAEGEEKAEEESAPAAEEPKEEEKAEEKAEDEPEEEPKIQSLGFGFVNFAEHEAAAAAVESLNGLEVETIVDGETIKQELFVGRAQKKSERERELRAKFEAQKMDRISKFQGVNLYVKNLDDTVTDDMLRDEFATMGTITSARVMRDLKADRSRGFGFVCYSTPEEATRAVNEMNGKIIGNKPIFVALAQRREVRRAQLEAQHAQQRGAPGQQMMRGGPMGAFPPGSMPIYMQRTPPGGSMQPAYPMMPQMMGGPGRGGAAAGGRGGYPAMIPGRGGNFPMAGAYGNMPQQGGRGGGRMPNQGRGGRGRGGQMQQGRGGPNAAQGRGAGIKFNQQVRNAGPATMAPAQPISQQPVPQPEQQPAPAQPEAHEPLTAASLASASPDVQKNMIGERLYPLIHNSEPELAGKITGMLLEMDNSELLHLLESPDALNSKISEALQVLDAHTQSAD
jgi:polyadenylate-binding protein